MYLPKLLFQITFEAIKGKEMFIAPIPANLLYGYGPTKFRKLKMVDLEAAVNTFPLDHSEWVEAQAVISTVFQTCFGKPSVIRSSFNLHQLYTV